MIPKEKHNIVSRWSAVKVMGWKWEDGYDDQCETKYTGWYSQSGECLYSTCGIKWWNPCTDLNDCKLVVDRLTDHQLSIWWNALCCIMHIERDFNEIYFIANAPADIRMMAVLKVFFPNKNIAEILDQ